LAKVILIARKQCRSIAIVPGKQAQHPSYSHQKLSSWDLMRSQQAHICISATMVGSADEDKRAFILASAIIKISVPTETGRMSPDCPAEVNVQKEDQMKVLAILFTVGTAVGIVAGVSAAPAESRIQLAQAQGSGTQAGTGAGASQRGSVGTREGGGSTSGASQERGTATRQSGDGSVKAGTETTRTNRTTVRERAGGSRVSVHGGTRRVGGVRASTGDDAVVIRRKRARGYVYSGPSTTLIKKKRYVRYREPSPAVIIKKRRPAIAVEGGSTRTTVRSQASTTVRDSGTTRENVRGGASVRERSIGAGNSGGRSGGQGGQDGQDAQPATSGRSGAGAGASQNSGTGNAAGSR
jgi:hypothetical protein